MEKYLFITVPNNSGSKLLVQLVGGCRNAVYLPGCREGERFVNIASANSRYWTQTHQLETMENEDNYDFNHIKHEWMKLWKQCPNYKTADPKVFLEKSPPNVLRAQMYEKNFPNAYFLIMVRNPYATIEGILRRCTKKRPIDIATKHWIDTTKKQIENINVLERNTYFTYEELCDTPKKAKEKIVALLPELSDIQMRKKVTMPAYVLKRNGSITMPPTNLNNKQIKNLSKEDIESINKYLEGHEDLLEFFGYEKIK